MQKLAILNQKGGVGKTTTALALSDILAAPDFNILLIDLDPQASITGGLGLDTTRGTVAECFRGNRTLGDIATEMKSGLFVIPSGRELARVEMEMARGETKNTLKGLLSGLNFGLCIIDCPPHLGLLTTDALTAATGAILPVKTEFYDLAGTAGQLAEIRGELGTINPRLEIIGLLPTQYDRRLVLHNEALAALGGIGLPVFDPIPKLVAVAESAGNAISIASYAPQSPATGAYQQLADKVKQWQKSKVD